MKQDPSHQKEVSSCCGHSQSYHWNGAGECIYETNQVLSKCECKEFISLPVGIGQKFHISKPSPDTPKVNCPNYGLKPCKLVGCPYHDAPDTPAWEGSFKKWYLEPYPASWKAHKVIEKINEIISSIEQRAREEGRDEGRGENQKSKL